MNILIGTPYYREVDARFASSMWEMLIFSAEQGYTCSHFFVQGTSAPTQRNLMAKTAVGEGYDYLLTVDSDMVFPHDALLTLLEADKGIIGAIAVGRIGDNKNRLMVFAKDCADTDGQFLQYKSWEDLPSHTEPFMVEGIGSSFLLMKTAVLEQFLIDNLVCSWGLPYNLWQLPSGRQLGTDLSFCHRANLYKIELWADPRVRLGHVYDDVKYPGDENE